MPLHSRRLPMRTSCISSHLRLQHFQVDPITGSTLQMRKPRLPQVKSLIQDTESGAGLGRPGADITLLLATLPFAPTLEMKGQQGFWMEKVKRAVFTIKAAGPWWLWVWNGLEAEVPSLGTLQQAPLLSWSPVASAAGPQPPLPLELTLSIQAGDAEAHGQPLLVFPPQLLALRFIPHDGLAHWPLWALPRQN